MDTIIDMVLIYKDFNGLLIFPSKMLKKNFRYASCSATFLSCCLFHCSTSTVSWCEHIFCQQCYNVWVTPDVAMDWFHLIVSDSSPKPKQYRQIPNDPKGPKRAQLCSKDLFWVSAWISPPVTALKAQGQTSTIQTPLHPVHPTPTPTLTLLTTGTMASLCFTQSH